ncbi:MAG: NAD(P)/FAD-dependent oxidoreductase [Cellulosilyticaceae bacterium]
MYDVVVVGAGICGASIARELSRYTLDVLVVEKENDVAMGTTKANSGIVHAGYDPEPGTLMAKYNVQGSQMMQGLCEELDVPYKRIGSLVLAFSDEEVEHLKKLYARGQANGVEGLGLLTKEEVMAYEPNLNTGVVAALMAPSAAVVGPYELAIAMMNQAVVNGVLVWLGHRFTGVRWLADHFEIELIHHGETKCIQSRYIVNAAGLYADEVAELLEPVDFEVRPQKGQYYLLDKSQGDLVHHVVFQCPSEKGKGVLVAPTAHGNLIVGPDAQDVSEGADVSTTSESLGYVRQMAANTCEAIAYRENIRNFSGNRALTNRADFIIGYSQSSQSWINVAGIKSPGLSAAPAIAIDVTELLGASGMQLEQKDIFKVPRPISKVEGKTPEELGRLIEENAAYGHIICRCEKVSEAEIVAAIHSPVPARTVEAIKRRVRAGAGRCQGGFCAPKVVEILSRELEIPMEEVCLDQEDSQILMQRTKKGAWA